MSYGVSSDLQYTELLFDSAGTTFSGQANSPTNDWPFFYFTTKNFDMAAIKVLQMEIPNVFDTVNSVNQTFIYNNGVNNLITIAVGNPTGAQLATALQTAISAISAGFTVTWDSATLKFTFTQALAISWSLVFPSKLTMYATLGFSVLETYTATGAASTIVSPNIAQITGPYYLNLNSRTAGPFIECNSTDGAPGGGINPTICRIPIDVNKGAVIFYKDPTPDMWFDFIGSRFQYLDFYLTLGNDQNTVPLDMKGAPWSIKLGVLTQRKAAGADRAVQIGA